MEFAYGQVVTLRYDVGLLRDGVRVCLRYFHSLLHRRRNSRGWNHHLVRQRLLGILCGHGGAQKFSGLVTSFRSLIIETL